jgi:replication factor C subunit 1
MDGIQPAVKSALTKAYKQGSASRVVRTADLINIPGMKKPLKKRVAAILEPVEESMPEENGVASTEADEEESSDAENNDGMCFFASKLLN